MTEKRFVNKGKDIFQYGEWWCSANGEHCADVIATAINELIEENEQLKSKNRGLQSELQIFKEDVTHSNLQNNKLTDENEQLKSENDSYKNIFFEIVETALTDTNCKKLYCKGILDIFDKANSLNQAREMIKEHLE